MAPENDRNFGPMAPSERPEDALAVASDVAEASENVVRAANLSQGSPVPLASLGAGLRPAAPQPPGPSDPKGRPLLRLLDGAEASDSEASRSASAGAPSPTPLRVRWRRPGEVGLHRLGEPCSAGLGGAPPQGLGRPAGPSRGA
jgi:hypothetical protein